VEVKAKKKTAVKICVCCPDEAQTGAHCIKHKKGYMCLLRDAFPVGKKAKENVEGAAAFNAIFGVEGARDLLTPLAVKVVVDFVMRFPEQEINKRQKRGPAEWQRYERIEGFRQW